MPCPSRVNRLLIWDGMFQHSHRFVIKGKTTWTVGKPHYWWSLWTYRKITSFWRRKYDSLTFWLLSSFWRRLVFQERWRKLVQIQRTFSRQLCGREWHGIVQTRITTERWFQIRSTAGISTILLHMSQQTRFRC